MAQKYIIERCEGGMTTPITVVEGFANAAARTGSSTCMHYRPISDSSALIFQEHKKMFERR